jgi:hypothetical protein
MTDKKCIEIVEPAESRVKDSEPGIYLDKYNQEYDISRGERRGTLPDAYDEQTADEIAARLERRGAVVHVFPADLLRGRVVDQRGDPVEGATVTADVAARGERTKVASATTDRNGRFRIEGFGERAGEKGAADTPAVTFTVAADGEEWPTLHDELDWAAFRANPREYDQLLEAQRPIARERKPTTWIRCVEGLPSVEATGTVSVLSDDRVAVGQDGTLAVYELDRSGGVTTAERVAEYEFAARVVHASPLDETRVIVVTEADETAVHVASANGTARVWSGRGRFVDAAVGGDLIFLAVDAAGRYPPRLLELEAETGGVRRASDLDTAAVSLTVAASGRYLGLVDSTNRRVFTRSTTGYRDEDLDWEPGVAVAPKDDGGSLVLKPDGTLKKRGAHAASSCESWVDVDADAGGAVDVLEGVKDYDIIVMWEATMGRGRLNVLDSETLTVVAARALSSGEPVIVPLRARSAVLSYDRTRDAWEELDLDELPDDPLVPLSGALVSTGGGSITHDGRSTYSGRALNGIPTEGTVRLLCVPLLEPEQEFGDMDALGAFLTADPWAKVNAYYDEVSYRALDVRIETLGYDVADAPAGDPLVLPKNFEDYFYGEFSAGRLRATASSNGSSYEFRFDGTERATLVAEPQNRPATTLELPFNALGFTATYDVFPTLEFDGSETMELAVTDSEGDDYTLSLAFDAERFAIEPDAVESGLAAVGNFFDETLRGAEQVAGVPTDERLLAPVAVRRVKTRGMAFGELHVDLSLAEAGPRKGRVELVSETGVNAALNTPLTALEADFLIASPSPSAYVNYVNRILSQALADAGFDFRDPLLAAGVDVTYENGALTTEIILSEADGGAGATVRLTDQSGLEAIGLDAAQSVDGSDWTVDDQHALKDGRVLLEDVHAGIVDRITDGFGDGITYPETYLDDFFGQYDAVVCGFVGEDTLGTRWGASAANGDLSDLRMFHWIPGRPVRGSDDDHALDTHWLGAVLSETPDVGTTAHEIGHALGFGDFYDAREHRDDLGYMFEWALMHRDDDLPHPCGYNKRKAGWIPERRVVTVPMPRENGTEPVAALLVPVEYWDDDIEADVRAVYQEEAYDDLDVAQLMHVELGGDRNQFDLVEVRQSGRQFSQSIPFTPALVVTNALDYDDDTRYFSTEGKYRRRVHLLNERPIANASGVSYDSGNYPQQAGDSFDFGDAPELAFVGTVAAVVDVRNVPRSDPSKPDVNVFHVEIEREDAKYVDLAFTQTTPNWKSPDVWVDWIGDNDSGDPDDHRKYPVGTPLGQGERVRTPKDGVEPHWIVGRVWNKGTGVAENVVVDFYLLDPAGSGDTKQFTRVGKETIDAIPAHDTSVQVPWRWDVGPSTNEHSCIRLEIADWTVAERGTTSLVTDDVRLSNNWVQQNVNEFVALSGSPYAPFHFQYSLANAGRTTERAWLRPEGLVDGMTLTITPELQEIPPGGTALFDCVLELNHEVIDSGCRTDPQFLVTAWRETPHAQERWGGCKYVVRPRVETAIDIHGHWYGTVDISGSVTPSDVTGDLLFHLRFDDGTAVKRTTPITAGGSVQVSVQAPSGATTVSVYAEYEGDAVFGPSQSDVIDIPFNPLQ